MATVAQALSIAIAHHQAGRLEVAEDLYRRILAVEPDHADALHLLGVAVHQRGEHALAVDYLRRATEMVPNAAVGHSNLGSALLALGRLDEAIAAYRRALELTPHDAETWNNLGTALFTQRNFAAAASCYREAVAQNPRHVEAHDNLAIALQECGQLDEAAASCRRALELAPHNSRAYTNLGNILIRRGEFDDAAVAFQRALQWEPNSALLHDNLGVALRGQGKLTEAVACHQRALQLNPNHAAAYNNLGNAFTDLGQLDEAVACYRRALQVNPNYAEVHANLLLGLEYCGSTTPAELTAAYAEFERRHGTPLRSTWPQHRNVRDPARTLRLGFVSAEFGQHPMAYISLRGVECLRAEDCHIVCYSNQSSGQDPFTARFRAAAHAWRDVWGMSDAALAEQIQADQIDILFDLSAHFSGNRLLCLARKPAPIQIAWEGPTGLAAMDYLLTDRFFVPPGSETLYREQVLRMPDAFACFVPPPHAPEVGPLPAEQRGHVTFGTLNNLAKIGPAVIRTWAAVLRRLPTARLVFRQLNSAAGAADCQGVLAAFAEQGVEAGRIEVVGRVPYAERLDLYQQLDITLDPFPFCGGMTTYESLWMGVPMVTYPGATFYSRMSLPHLFYAGLDDLVAQDLPDYVERAVALAQDLPRLAAIRTGLRPRLAASPLYDGPRFSRHLMQLLRSLWSAWCRR